MTSPVLTIDGPSGSGKGTIAARVAGALGWHLLDSGALYRLVGLLATRKGVDFNDENALSELAKTLDVVFLENKIILEKQEVRDEIRTEQAGAAASLVGAVPAVRTALLERQRAFATSPGLVADGRDMGTVVFPGAGAKIFLTASPEERAQRRYNQLIEKGFSASLPTLIDDIRARDERDATRKVAPLAPAEDALVLDSTRLNIDEVTAEVLGHVYKKWPDLRP